MCVALSRATVALRAAAAACLQPASAYASQLCAECTTWLVSFGPVCFTQCSYVVLCVYVSCGAARGEAVDVVNLTGRHWQQLRLCSAPADCWAVVCVRVRASTREQGCLGWVWCVGRYQAVRHMALHGFAWPCQYSGCIVWACFHHRALSAEAAFFGFVWPGLGWHVSRNLLQ